jgi:hypothetical protein
MAALAHWEQALSTIACAETAARAARARARVLNCILVIKVKVDEERGVCRLLRWEWR